ncbi:ABC transporter permease [uncultured Alistipes sp.]|jgi:hypothetical protein|uniref:ABC transporter permease n=1 Tax=uncultured Alistipes sp. TaxID=538949 RepID=UPI0025F55C72|nr:ABC transporter permease [uncultured Alistipes sp.]
MRTLLVLLDKEFRQFFRNPFLPRMVVAFPLMVMFIIPWVTTMDVHHVGVAVVDNDRSQASRRIITKIASSDYFTLQEVSETYAVSLRTLEEGDVDVIVEIPEDFEKEMMEGSPKRLSIAANGVNAVKGNLGSQYVMQTVMQTLSELRAEQGLAPSADLITIQNRYNPTLEYRNYMIPALMIILLVMLCGFLPALNLVSEKEVGTIEQINVTPVSRFTFTLAKLIPFWIMGIAVLVVTMLVAWAVYGLFPIGSFWTIMLAALLFTLTMSGIGVICANYSSTMQQTMFVMFFFIMLFMLMSGLMTPIESMPDWAQKITYAFPPRYFIEIMRSVYLKGTTITELGGSFLGLVISAVVCDLWAALSYRKRA